MTNFSSSLDFARQLDQQDSLASYRKQFVANDPDLIYLDGNSLGRLPKSVIERMKKAVEEEWGTDLIRGWNKGWWESPSRIGNKIGSLLGAAESQVVVGDQTSINLFKLATAALTLQPQKKRIITDTFNFPSDLYVLQGIVQFLTPSLTLGKVGQGHEIIRIGAIDNDITPDLAALEAAIDENTSLVTLSHVTFKSGYLYDMAHITELAHRKGALVLWDLSHSAGAVPIELDRCDVDFAIGCTYKYLNGGPGAPAFLICEQAPTKRSHISDLGLVGAEGSVRVRSQLPARARRPAISCRHRADALHAGDGGSIESFARSRDGCPARANRF